ncbi:MAG TPA: amidase, partial [Rhizomicrobium sp.]|nr:amidase [Rhizomicrobium sp.]
IARIESHNPLLNAVTYKAFDEARAACDGALSGGPFKGVPFLVKDMDTPVAGWPMTNGSAFLQHNRADRDCELVRRYRTAGLVLLGRTNAPEFGIPGTTEGRHLGICRNPWNPDHSAGGSSGGAGAAVASGMVPMAHGSDGLGSIRIPSALCGVVGLKPTQYRNPGGPDDRVRAHGMVVDHVLTRTVRDCAVMLDWTGWPEDDAPYAAPAKMRPYAEEIRTPPGRLKIAFHAATTHGGSVHEEVLRVFDATVALLGTLGHTLIEKPSLGIDWKGFYRAQMAVTGAVFAAEIDGWSERLGRAPRDDELEPLAWAAYSAAKSLTGADVGAGLGTLRVTARQILALWRDFDVLLTPVTITPAPPIGHLDPVHVEPREFHRRQGRAFNFTPPYNVTGQPSLSLPLGKSRDGLPIGMMFTARLADEAALFRLAAQLEQAQSWADLRPPIFGMA